MCVAEESEAPDAVKVDIEGEIQITKWGPVSNSDGDVKESINWSAIVEVDEPDELMIVVNDHIRHAHIVVTDDDFAGGKRLGVRFTWVGDGSSALQVTKKTLHAPWAPEIPPHL